jgi:hypothetical protein
MENSIKEVNATLATHFISASVNRHLENWETSYFRGLTTA